MIGSLRSSWAAIALVWIACGDNTHPAIVQQQPIPTANVAGPTAAPSAPVDPQLQHDREQYIVDAMAFTGLSHDQVDSKMTHETPMKDEWTAWEKSGAMTDARIKAFYKQTKNYIFDLGGWHFDSAPKRESDIALVAEMVAAKPKNILDF